MDFVQSFLGRFHPVLVHLPIGILILAFVFEVSSSWKRFEYLKPAVQPALLIGALSAAASCITGYFLSLEGGYAEKLLTPHLYAGVFTAILSFLLYFLRRTSIINRIKQKYAGILFFVPVIMVLSVTGHLGGSLTHGEEFLSFDLSGSVENPIPFKPIANLDQAVLYADVVQQILKSKCYACHSAKKQKGDLRLDEVDFIKQGGEHGEIIVSGLPDSSLIYKLLLLPLEDDRHMPPKGKLQPTSTEIAILQSWIEEGASFERQVKDLSKPEKMKRYIAALQTTATPHWVPAEEVSEPDHEAVALLKSKGVLVLPVSQNNNYIMINFINKRTVTEEDLTILLKLKKQLLWLNLAGTSIADDQLPRIVELEKLRWLYLNNTQVSDEGITALLKLPHLMFINLVNTQLTDQGLGNLAGLKKLEKLFVYRTKISRAGIAAFQKIQPKVNIDTGGYVLPQISSDSIIFKRKKI